MNPKINWEETAGWGVANNPTVVIDLTGEDEWIKNRAKRPDLTWWIHKETAEKLLVALVNFFHPESLPEEGSTTSRRQLPDLVIDPLEQ